MKGQMDGWHGDEDWLSAKEAKYLEKNEDDSYERWISDRYLLHKNKKLQEFKNNEDL